MEVVKSEFTHRWWVEYFEECNDYHSMDDVTHIFNKKILHVIDLYGINVKPTISEQTLLEILISLSSMLPIIPFDTIKYFFDNKPGINVVYYVNRYFFEYHFGKMITTNHFLDMFLIFIYKSRSYGWNAKMFDIQFESAEQASFYDDNAFKNLIYFIYRLVMIDEIYHICLNNELYIKKNNSVETIYKNIICFLENFLSSKPLVAIPYIIITNQAQRTTNLMKMVFKELNKKI